MPGTVTTRGERELALRFDTFPSQAHAKLQERIATLTDALEERAQSLAPVRTGLLRSEIAKRVYGDSPKRVAGYVQVVASNQREYPKAAALEYGVNKPRRIFERVSGGGLLTRATSSRRRIVERLSKPVHMRAFRYLRGAFDEIRPEVEAALQEALQEAIGDTGT